MSGEKAGQSIEGAFESIRRIMAEDEAVARTPDEDVLELTALAPPDGDDAAAGEARSGNRAAAFPGADDRAELLSEAAKAASMSSFGTLVSEILSRRDAADSSAEDLVKEMMQPMIREWLDANLPALVEGLVEREIRRLAETAGDRA